MIHLIIKFIALSFHLSSTTVEWGKYDVINIIWWSRCSVSVFKPFKWGFGEFSQCLKEIFHTGRLICLVELLRIPTQYARYFGENKTCKYPIFLNYFVIIVTDHQRRLKYIRCTRYVRGGQLRATKVFEYSVSFGSSKQIYIFQHKRQWDDHIAP